MCGKYLRPTLCPLKASLTLLQAFIHISTTKAPRLDRKSWKRSWRASGDWTISTMILQALESTPLVRLETSQRSRSSRALVISPTFGKKFGAVNDIQFQSLWCGSFVNLADVENLDEVLDTHVGLGHTRWASLGDPTIENAHPHASDSKNEFIVVHNGKFKMDSFFSCPQISPFYCPFSPNFRIFDQLCRVKNYSD